MRGRTHDDRQNRSVALADSQITSNGLLVRDGETETLGTQIPNFLLRKRGNRGRYGSLNTPRFTQRHGKTFSQRKSKPLER